MRPLRVLSLLLLFACSRRLPEVSFSQAPTPEATSTPLSLCWLEYTHNKQPGLLAYQGPDRKALWELTVSGILVRHPNGHLLLDTGANSHARKDDLPEMNNFLDRTITRSVTRKKSSKSVLAALQELNEEVSQLSFVILTHIHGDHAGGLVDLEKAASIPVVVRQEELAFAKDPEIQGILQVFSQHISVIEEHQQPLTFVDAPYSIFPKHKDIFGDGSVVLVPLPGHTPGSLGIFLSLPSGKRLFYVGDAINDEGALAGPFGKSLILKHTDNDHKGADHTTSVLAALHKQDPSLLILPAHDREAWLTLFGEPTHCLE